LKVMDIESVCPSCLPPVFEGVFFESVRPCCLLPGLELCEHVETP